jgi:hypothetical protein
VGGARQSLGWSLGQRKRTCSMHHQVITRCQSELRRPAIRPGPERQSYRPESGANPGLPNAAYGNASGRKPWGNRANFPNARQSCREIIEYLCCRRPPSWSCWLRWSVNGLALAAPGAGGCQLRLWDLCHTGAGPGFIVLLRRAADKGVRRRFEAGSVDDG